MNRNRNSPHRLTASVGVGGNIGEAGLTVNTLLDGKMQFSGSQRKGAGA